MPKPMKRRSLPHASEVAASDPSSCHPDGDRGSVCLMRTVVVEAERGIDGRYSAVNPFTGRRVYASEARGQSVVFSRLVR